MCFSIEYDDAQGGSDIMCLKKGQFDCIFTGNLISDNSYVAVTASSGRCRPFSSDRLEVCIQILLFHNGSAHLLLLKFIAFPLNLTEIEIEIINIC